MRHPFTGCGTALVTPFTRDEQVDEAAVRRLARRQIDAGIHFLVPCGTTGENPAMSSDEHRRVVEITVKTANGRVPVLAGAGRSRFHRNQIPCNHQSNGPQGYLSARRCDGRG